MNRGWTSRIGLALFTAALASGCAMSDDTASKFLVAPGGYQLYSCPQLRETAVSLRTRQRQLERLMAKADTDVGGQVMSTIGYRPEYLKIRGQLHDVEATARGKQCDLSAPTPAADAPSEAAEKPAPARR